MYAVEVGCDNGSVYFYKYRSDDFNYILNDLRKWIIKIDWTSVDYIIIKEDIE